MYPFNSHTSFFDIVAHIINRHAYLPRSDRSVHKLPFLPATYPNYPVLAALALVNKDLGRLATRILWSEVQLLDLARLAGYLQLGTDSEVCIMPSVAASLQG